MFRTETALVRLDVSVLDAKGNAIRDLMPSDFELRQDGKQRPVVFAEFRQVADLGQAGHDADARIGIASGGRRLVIVVDDMRMSFENVVRVRQDLLAALVRNSLPDDQMMIVGTRGGARTVAFTRDPVVLAEQVEALRWEAPTRNNQPDTDERRR
ncbi:MAG TPA: hypothetical protein VK527_02790, partial [Candidatus Limnocylindrales bacterium]|nr:hypothetical protein [Candidatus Limnocylindrales bacterium]